ncbi:filament integrity protein FraC [Brunnivagina elsteri]|uniref:Filament integrity protein fraC n=1 Tax=Brunnivagina elsteri CCALA 953 TaxID=987040 RepID=A0A2A2TPL3_9CYAN|nr:filament integrity protein FraC [Calothrix elsteri]PAX60390.1 filament integrity protein fraC [Calothrix elsteri CCALA 953]
MFDLPVFPFFDLAPVFPLGAILFNFLFFTVTIPVEAYILAIRLKFDKRTSIFYSIGINLFSGALGWLIFFLIEPILPLRLKSDLINVVFFDQFNPSIRPLVVITAFIIFFATFLIKFVLLKLALLSLRDISKPPQPTEQASTRKTSRRTGKLKLQNTNLLTTILIANSLSYSFISLIMLLRTIRTNG